MQIRNPGAAPGIGRDYGALLAGERAARGVRLVNGNVCAPEIASSAGDAGALRASVLFCGRVGVIPDLHPSGSIECPPLLAAFREASACPLRGRLRGRSRGGCWLSSWQVTSVTGAFPFRPNRPRNQSRGDYGAVVGEMQRRLAGYERHDTGRSGGIAAKCRTACVRSECLSRLHRRLGCSHSHEHAGMAQCLPALREGGSKRVPLTGWHGLSRSFSRGRRARPSHFSAAGLWGS